MHETGAGTDLGRSAICLVLEYSGAKKHHIMQCIIKELKIKIDLVSELRVEENIIGMNIEVQKKMSYQMPTLSGNIK